MDVGQVHAVIKARYDGSSTLTTASTRLLFGFPAEDEFSRRPWVALTLEGFEDVTTFDSGYKNDYDATVKFASNSAQPDKVTDFQKAFRDRFHEVQLSGTGVTALWLLHVGTSGPLLIDGAYEIEDKYTVAVDWA